MKKNLISALFTLSVAAISCTGSDDATPVQLREEALISIRNIEQQILEKEGFTPDTPRIEELCRLMLTYVRNNPEDSNVPEMLFKAGELSAAVGQYDRALNMLGRVYSDFPQYDKHVESLYLSAFIYETNLGDKARAEEAYKKIIDKHPRHEMAIQAAAALDVLYLSDEELLQRLGRGAALQ
jgi:tetratricopeptide (TPR) repeat protein